MTATDQSLRLELERRVNDASSCDAVIVALAEFFVASELVFGHGTDNANDEAFWLLRHLQEWHDVDWARAPNPEIARAAVDLATRRASERKPLAYLLGEAWFADLRFNIDERVLVPRSPLAETIERAFAPWCALRPGDRVLDIGTGSGCLAIAAAHYAPGVLVDATDVSTGALAVAATNVLRHDVGDRVRLYEADLFPATDTRYRVIVSNPPYVSDAEMAALPAEYLAEPELGLRGGPKGYEPVERLLRGARERLTPDGCVFVEVGAGAAAFADAYPKLPLVWLEFERGGDGVFALTAEDLEQFLHAG